MINLNDVKENTEILEFIKKTEDYLSELAYTDHGLRHSSLVAERALRVAGKIGLTKRQAELASIAGFCHDMGNFLGRNYHNYLAAILFHQVFQGKFKPSEMTDVMQAISTHDERIREASFKNPISAVVVLADKADVHRSRVLVRDLKKIKTDIHDRVNYATTKSELKVDKKRITLSLEIDTGFVKVMEYFEIFTRRMVLCRKAAESLGYDFGLEINKFKLL